MNDRLTEEQVDDLLDTVIGTYNPNYWKDGEKLICCPVHGESNPSMGVSIEKQVCHCFSCDFAGNFAKLLSYALPDDFGLDTSTVELEKKTSFRAYLKAREFLKLRYELEYHELGQKLHAVKRYEQAKMIDISDLGRKEIPMFKIAPFKSGKETYQYFFDRGFTVEDMKEYKIGRDLDNGTVTIPVFFEDGVLAGVIGRYISKKRKKNERYKIYDGFDRGQVLFPVDKFEPENDTIILIEGQFDAMRMRKAGFNNSLALMTNNLTNAQAEWIIEHCSTVIWLGDNDERGLEGRDKAYNKLKDQVKFLVVDYPEHGKDVCNWSDDEIGEMVDNAHSMLNRKIRRL